MKDYYLDKNILITGASGYIGSKLLEKLSKCRCTIYSQSRIRSKSQSNTNARIVHISGELNDKSIYENISNDIDVIFHLAGQTNIYWAEEHPIEDLKINIEAFIYLLEYAKRCSHASVIFTSSATVVGLNNDIPINESSPANPITTYDLNKYICEQYLKFYVDSKWINGCSLRLPNIYGPGVASSSVNRGVINQVVKRAIQGCEIDIYGKGNYLRDYLYIDDTVSALLAAGENTIKMHGEHFILGTGIGITLGDAFKRIVERVSNILNKEIEIQKKEIPEGLSPIEFRNYVAEADLFKEVTGWLPKYNFDDGISRLIDYYMESR